MFLLFNAAQPYVYVIIGATVVVFAIVVIVFARLQKRPNNYVPDNIDESVDKAAEKLKKHSPKPYRPPPRSKPTSIFPAKSPKKRLFMSCTTTLLKHGKWIFIPKTRSFPIVPNKLKRKRLYRQGKFATPRFGR